MGGCDFVVNVNEFLLSQRESLSKREGRFSDLKVAEEMEVSCFECVFEEDFTHVLLTFSVWVH